MTKKAYCPQHPLTTPVCPKCIGKKGGTATSRKHKKELSEWGRKGGLPKGRK
jgi:hypothetical protein